MQSKIQPFLNQIKKMVIPFGIGTLLLFISCFFGPKLPIFSEYAYLKMVLFLTSLYFLGFTLHSFSKKEKTLSIRFIIIAFSFAALLSGIITLSSIVEMTNYWNANLFQLGKVFVFSFPFCFNFTSFFLSFSIKNHSSENFLSKIQLLPEQKKRWGCFACLMIIGLWMLCIFYPGIFSYDAPIQLTWYQRGYSCTHHPLLHTFLLGFLMKSGNQLTGSYNIGCLLYCILQLALFSFALERAVLFVARKNRKASLFFLLFIVLVPLHSIMAITTIKDVPFTAFLLFWILLILKGHELEKWSFSYVCQTILVLIFFCLFRNNGIYVAVVSVPFWLLLERKHWRGILIISAGFILFWILYTNPVYSLLKVEKGDIKETLSVPIQQLSRAFIDEGLSLSDEIKSQILSYIPDAKDYALFSADFTKETFNNELYAEKPMAFWKLWWDVFRLAPRQYLIAFLELNDSFYMPWTYYTRYGATVLSFETTLGGQQIIHIQSLFPALRETLENFFVTEKQVAHFPILSLLIDGGFFFFLLLMEIARVLYQKRWGLCMAIVPIFLLFGTCILGPVALYRYMFPIILGTALLFIPVFTGQSQS